MPNLFKDKVLRAQVITWNMHGNPPPPEIEMITRAGDVMYHLIVIGTEECCHSIAASFFNNSKKKWIDCLRANLKNDYREVKHTSMNAMGLNIFVHSTIENLVNNVQTKNVACGAMGICNNKGAMGCSFRIGNRSFLAINCHLASGHKAIAKRNADFHKIQTSMRLPKGRDRGDYKFALTTRFDHVFWTGDFNYRIEGPDPAVLVQQSIAGNYKEILTQDQLQSEQKKGNVLVGYKEGDINFPPTYKFSDKTDILITEKGKNVGYCDRIFFGGRDDHKLNVLNYDCISEMLWGDHKPVFAQVEIEMDGLDPARNYQPKEKPEACVIF